LSATFSITQPDSCFVALGKWQHDRPSCFTDSEDIPTIVRYSDN
jgi:hypothetical protein